VKSAKDVPFGDFDQKNFTHPLVASKFQNFALRKPFFAQIRIKSATKFCSRIGNSPWEFRIFGLKFEQK